MQANAVNTGRYLVAHDEGDSLLAEKVEYLGLHCWWRIPNRFNFCPVRQDVTKPHLFPAIPADGHFGDDLRVVQYGPFSVDGISDPGDTVSRAQANFLHALSEEPV